MQPERVRGRPCGPPFPVYESPLGELLATREPALTERDATVAHVLGTCAGYAYSDADTVAAIMARLGLGGNACVRISQTVDAMFIYSTAYLVQSRCGRVVILCYRGTEPATLGSWLADIEVGSSAFRFAGDDAKPLRVHAGFHRSRATRETFSTKAAGRSQSVAIRSEAVEHHRSLARPSVPFVEADLSNMAARSSTTIPIREDAAPAALRLVSDRHRRRFRGRAGD